MIEVVRQVDPGPIQAWLETYIRPSLTPDVSNYAKGRLRCWLGWEPMLYAPFTSKPAVPTRDETWLWLQDALSIRFDYCLVTWSGPDATGILPHRDAGYADYEAWGWHVNGDCRFDYWNDRQSFYAAMSSGEAPSDGPPTHQLGLRPGDLVRFNCKNTHAATPSVGRWNLNFWRRSRRV